MGELKCCLEDKTAQVVNQGRLYSKVKCSGMFVCSRLLESSQHLTLHTASKHEQIVYQTPDSPVCSWSTGSHSSVFIHLVSAQVQIVQFAFTWCQHKFN